MSTMKLVRQLVDLFYESLDLDLVEVPSVAGRLICWRWSSIWSHNLAAAVQLVAVSRSAVATSRFRDEFIRAI
jgi:hypothetical protein